MIQLIKHWLWKRKINKLMDEDDKLITKHAQLTGQIPKDWSIHTHRSGFSLKYGGK